MTTRHGTIRWNPRRMRQLASDLDRVAAAAGSMRTDAYRHLLRVGSGLQLRHLALAESWAGYAARTIRIRRGALLEAESGLVADVPAAVGRTRRYRPVRAIVRDLDDGARGSSVSTPGSLRQLELTRELALARRHRRIMAAELPPDGWGEELDHVIDYLDYEIAKLQPRLPPDITTVERALEIVRGLLNESWFADVGRADLLAMTAVLSTLSGPELDAVIARLNDDELYRWFHELDGVRGGNLNLDEEADQFALIASRGSVATAWRLAGAERGSRFAAIAEAVRTAAPPVVAMEFIELCAANAADSEDALLAAVEGLAALNSHQRWTVLHSLSADGLLGQLATATDELLADVLTRPSDPALIEFGKGFGTALVEGGISTLELTAMVFFDRHRFREAWSAVGTALHLLVTDPFEFVAAVADIEEMRRNPARWAGGATVGLASAGMGKLAGAGKLGKAAGRIEAWLRQWGDRRDLPLVPVSNEKVVDAIGALADAADGAARRRLIGRLDEIAAGRRR